MTFSDLYRPKSKSAHALLITGLILVILVFTFLIYFPALDNDFTQFDDNKYIYNNAFIKDFSVDGVKRIFKTLHSGNYHYHPLTILSWSFEYHFYQKKPFGYILNNILLHLMNTSLVFIFIYLLSKNLVAALITSLLFGIHPMHVESVAWASMRKDVLFSLFYLSSLIAYCYYAQKHYRSWGLIIISFFLFTLAILSKQAAFSLPLILVLMDIYQKRKLDRKFFLEKIPFFLISIVFALIAVSQKTTMPDFYNVPKFEFFDRILFSSYAFIMYLVKACVPLKLSCFYSFPQKINNAYPAFFYIAPVIVLLLINLSMKYRRSSRSMIFGLLFFSLTIFNTLGLISSGSYTYMMAERYTYLPYIGLFFILGIFIKHITTKYTKMITICAFLIFGVYSLSLSYLTFQQVDVWQNTVTLWSNVIKNHPNTLEAYSNRALFYRRTKRVELAKKDLDQALKIDPNFIPALINRGNMLARDSQDDLAIIDYSKAIELNPNIAIAYVNRGNSYLKQGYINLALNDFNQSLILDPDNGNAYYNRSIVFKAKKRYKQALDDALTAKNLGAKTWDSHINELMKQVQDE